MLKYFFIQSSSLVLTGVHITTDGENLQASSCIIKVQEFFKEPFLRGWWLKLFPLHLLSSSNQKSFLNHGICPCSGFVFVSHKMSPLQPYKQGLLTDNMQKYEANTKSVRANSTDLGFMYLIQTWTTCWSS